MNETDTLSAEEKAESPKKKKEKKPIKEKEKRVGVFHALIDNMTEGLYRFFKSSFIGRLLAGGDRFDRALDESMTHTVFTRVKEKLIKALRKRPKKAFDTDDYGGTVGIFDENTIARPFKSRINGSIGSSVIINAIDRLIQRLVSIPVISVGLFLLSFGIATIVVQIIKILIFDYPAPNVYKFLQGAIILLVSIPALINRGETVSECLKRSRTGRFIVFSVMGAGAEFDRDQINDGRPHMFMFVFGLLCGLASYFVSPWYILLCILLIAAAIRTLYLPEFGVLFAVFALPFASLLESPSGVCLGASLYIVFCFLIKVFRGKRKADFVFTDFLVLLFAFICVITSAGSADGRSTACLYVALMLMYYVIRCLIRESRWEERCVNAWISSASLVSVIAIVQMTLKRGIYVSSVFDSELSMAWYLSVGFLITAANLFARKRHKPVLFLALLIQGAALVGSGSWLTVLITCFAAIVLLMVCNRKTVAVLLLLILAIPFISCFITGVRLSEFWRLLTFSEAGQSFKVSVWHTSSNIARDYFMMGTGLGRETFAEVFRSYAPADMELQSGSMSLALQVVIQLGIIGFFFLTCIVLSLTVRTFTLQKKSGGDIRHRIYAIGYYSALLSLLLLSIFCDIWSNVTVLCAFWMLAGFIPSCARCEKQTDNSDSDLIGEMSTDMTIKYD